MHEVADLQKPSVRINVPIKVKNLVDQFAALAEFVLPRGSLMLVLFFRRAYCEIRRRVRLKENDRVSFSTELFDCAGYNVTVITDEN